MIYSANTLSDRCSFCPNPPVLDFDTVSCPLPIAIRCSASWPCKWTASTAMPPRLLGRRVLDKHLIRGEILVQQGSLQADKRNQLKPLIEAHLTMRGYDVEAQP